MGLTLGLAFVAFGAAGIVIGKRLVVTEELEEDYPPEQHPADEEAIVALVDDSGSRLTRRRLLKLALMGSGAALGAALLTPLASLGPVFDLDRLVATPWRRGRRLVGEDGRPLRAADIEERAFYTAFPEGANREELASPLIVVRLPPASLHLPPANAGYDAHGIVAYSKICTHAGCAISLYRTPLFAPADPGPALVCPCHYSTFDPATGGTVTFGPAGRKLPMLPVYVDARGELRAKGTFDGPVGPSWWGVRSRAPRVIRSRVRFVDQRTASAPLLRKALRYVFPDHWSFLLGEVALYAFVVVVGTGIYLTLFYSDSTATVVYHGPYRPLRARR